MKDTPFSIRRFLKSKNINYCQGRDEKGKFISEYQIITSDRIIRIKHSLKHLTISTLSKSDPDQRVHVTYVREDCAGMLNF